MNAFLQLQTTQLGTMAENMLVNEFITSKGFTPYVPSIEASHPIDSMAMSWSGVSFYMDVKAKSRRKYFADTGIDLADYNKYIKYDKPTYILFADIIQGMVYGNWLSKMRVKIEGNIIYFPLEDMVPYRDLNEIEIATLKNLEKSNYYTK